MRFEKSVVASFNNDKKILISTSISEDSVVIKKISVEDFRSIVSQFNQILYEIDNGE